jgi:hypothetical protein
MRSLRPTERARSQECKGDVEGPHAQTLATQAVTDRMMHDPSERFLGGKPHDAVAPLAGPGAGAIYGPAHGRPVDEGNCYRVRASKPSGVSYDTFEAALLDFAGPGAAVWKRQMVLGPDHEFLIDTQTYSSGGLMGQHPDVTALQRAVQRSLPEEPDDHPPSGRRSPRSELPVPPGTTH